MIHCHTSSDELVISLTCTLHVFHQIAKFNGSSNSCVHTQSTDEIKIVNSLQHPSRYQIIKRKIKQSWPIPIIPAIIKYLQIPRIPPHTSPHTSSSRYPTPPHLMHPSMTISVHWPSHQPSQEPSNPVHPPAPLPISQTATPATSSPSARESST